MTQTLPPKTRDLLWFAVRRRRTKFHASDICRETDRKYPLVYYHLQQFEKAGVVRNLGRGMWVRA